MLNYAQTSLSRTIVPLPPVPCSQSQKEPITEPLSAMTQLPASPDWSSGESFGELYYQGKLGEIRIPGLMWMGCDAAFAQGFWRGRELLLEREDGNWSILTDQEFTDLLAQELPATLPPVAVAPWKQGFIFGWCMTWY